MIAAGLVEDRHEESLFDQATATFSACRRYRYTLTRVWDPSVQKAAFIMVNPSTADAFQLDPTLRRCKAFAESWGFGGLVVLNIFALRSTDPRALYDHSDPVGPANDLVIASRWPVTEPLQFGPDVPAIGLVIAAWGVHGVLNGRGAQVAEMLRARGVNLMCLGTTKDGHPRHPLYLPASAQPVPYEPIGAPA